MTLFRLVWSRRKHILLENLLQRRRDVLTFVPQTAGLRDELDRELEEMREDSLERIEKCLRDLEEGTYGICLGCRNEISENRLLKFPFARLCIECDLKAEFEYVRQEIRSRHRPTGTLPFD